MTNIYVGNLSFRTDDDGLRQAFEAFGTVHSAKVVMDRETGRSRGFGFVEMPDGAAAQAAIEGTNGKDLDGRNLRVNEARPREERPRNGGGGFGGQRPLLIRIGRRLAPPNTRFRARGFATGFVVSGAWVLPREPGLAPLRGGVVVLEQRGLQWLAVEFGSAMA